jgi:ribosomal protein L11 methylase PrmA
MYEIIVDMPAECLDSFTSEVLAGYCARYPGSSPDMERSPGGKVVLRDRTDRVDCLLRIVSDSLDACEQRTGSPESFRILQRSLDLPEQRPSSGSTAPFRPIPELEILHPSAGLAAAPEKGSILLDSGWAFGTGTHPTTVLCLQLLRDCLREQKSTPPGSCRALDLGCGSGVLALAAVVLGADEATGVDINPRAVEAAGRNARLNGLQERVRLLESSWERVRGRWDLILANITPFNSGEMSQCLHELLRPWGRAVVSGIGREQGRELESCCRRRGLLVQRTLHLDDWAGLLVCRT